MCVWVCVCVRMCGGVIITLPSIASCVCMYVCISMPTPLNDGDNIRQYFTVNCEVFCIKNDIVFPYNYIIQPSQ